LQPGFHHGLLGVVSAASIGLMAPHDGIPAPVVASDLMQPPTLLTLDDDLRKVGELILSSGLHQLPVLTTDGKLAGFIDESQVTRAYLKSSVDPDRPGD
jgi:predicted transcriptional regulator